MTIYYFWLWLSSQLLIPAAVQRPQEVSTSYISLLDIWNPPTGTPMATWHNRGSHHPTAIGSASLARSIRIRFHFRHRTGRIRSWPRVAVASLIQNTKLFTWRTWPGAGAVPKCDWAARRQCGFKQRRADHTVHLIGCDAWPIRYHYGTDDCMNMITRMTMHYFKCNRMENDNILLSHTYVTLQIGHKKVFQ